jgi:hypothetical protein
MKFIIRNTALLAAFSVFSPFATADVSGNWIFDVTLAGGAGRGTAEITMTQEVEGKISGSYSGQLANGAIGGTYKGNSFEFAITNDQMGIEIIYRGELEENATVTGSVIAQGQIMGAFSGKKKM